MKHLIKDGKVTLSGIPSNFTRSNGQTFWGGYENMTDLHYEDGWRDEIIPTYNLKYQFLGELYYDIDNDICTYKLENKVINLVNEKERLNKELLDLKRELSLLAMQAKLTYDEEPIELTELLSTIRGLNSVAKTEIESLTEINVLDYVLRGPQVEQLLTSLKAFL